MRELGVKVAIQGEQLFNNELIHAKIIVAFDARRTFDARSDKTYTLAPLLVNLLQGVYFEPFNSTRSSSTA